VKRGELNVLGAQIGIVLEDAFCRLAVEAHAPDMPDGKARPAEDRLARQDLLVADDTGEALFVEIRPRRFVARHRALPFRQGEFTPRERQFNVVCPQRIVKQADFYLANTATASATRAMAAIHSGITSSGKRRARWAAWGARPSACRMTPSCAPSPI